MEPTISAAAALVAKTAASKAVGAAVSKAASKLKDDEATRLLTLVAEDLNEAVGFAALQPLLEADDVLATLIRLLDDPAAVSADELAAEIAPHVGPLGDETDAQAYARLIAEACLRSVWRAKERDRDAIVLELRRQVAQLGGDMQAMSRPILLSEEWIPRSALGWVRALGPEHAHEAAALEQALKGVQDRPRELGGLIRDPQPWLKDGSAALWAAVGSLASSYGLLVEAQVAFVEASNRPGADRAGLLSRASQNAAFREDHDTASALRERARRIDPDHPELAVADARVLDDPREQLARVAGLSPVDPMHKAAVEVLRALAYLALGEAVEAEAAAGRALEVAPDNLLARMLRPAAVLSQNLQQVLDADPDVARLDEARKELLTISAELRDTGRQGEALRMQGEAARCAAVAGDVITAAKIVEGALNELATSPDEMASHVLALAALDAHRADLVERIFASPPLPWFGRPLLLKARLQRGEAVPTDELVAEAEELLAADEPSVRQEAALARAILAFREGVEWSNDAIDVIKEADAALAALIEATLTARTDMTAARAAVAAFQDDPRILDFLVHLAVREEDWATALQLQRSLVNANPTAERRLSLAQLLEASGAHQDAAAELDTLRGGGPRIPLSIRDAAASIAASLAWERSQVSRYDRITREWLELSPNNPTAQWMRIHAHHRLGRFTDAVALIDEHEMQPRNAQDAFVAAQCFRRALPPADALRRVIALADRFNRAEEALELMVIMTGLGSRDADIPEELHERRQEALEHFQSRFPESKALIQLDVPDDDEGLEQFFREHFSPGSGAVDEVSRKVFRGELGVAHLAAVVGKRVAEMWPRLVVLPLGYGDPLAYELEIADAAEALGKPAVWETSAFYVAGGLGDEILSAIRGYLPGSGATVAVVDDAVGATDVPATGEEGEILEAGWDSSAGRPSATVIRADEVARQRAAVAGILDTVHSLDTIDDRDAARPGRLDHLVERREQETANDPLLTLRATLATAARLGLPVYSDDRFVRAAARAFGLKTFGTPALIRALEAHGRIDPDTARGVLARLRLQPSHGLLISLDEILEEGRAHGWALTPFLVIALSDPTRWSNLQQAMNEWIEVLRAVLEEAPDTFDIWVARIIMSARAARPAHMALPPAITLITLAWVYGDDHFARRVREAVDTTKTEYGVYMPGDIDALAGSFVANALGGLPPAYAAPLFLRIIRRVPLAAQLEILNRVRFVDNDSPKPAPKGTVSTSPQPTIRRKRSQRRRK